MSRVGGTYDSRKSLKRGVYLLPNLVTTGGLFAGFYAIVAGMRGDFESAAIAIFFAMAPDLPMPVTTTSSSRCFGARLSSMSRRAPIIRRPADWTR